MKIFFFKQIHTASILECVCVAQRENSLVKIIIIIIKRASGGHVNLIQQWNLEIS